MRRALLAVMVCSLLASNAVAQPAAPSPSSPPAPSSDEAAKVIRYYYGGKDQGPVLVELRACLKVDAGKDSPNRGDCLETVSGPVAKNTNVHAWMIWLVPDGGSYDDVVLQYVYEGQVRASLDLSLSASLRSRVSRANTLSKSGNWQIRVVRGDKVLGTVPVVVK